MSLAQHVSSFEGVDQEYDEITELRLERFPSLSLSYDPLPAIAQGPVEKFESQPAYEVPQRLRIAQILVGVITCFTASGIVFGFDALKTILTQEEVYREYCSEEELLDGVKLCYLQDQRLNLTFVIASVTTNISALLVGGILDRYGPKVCGFISSVMLALGCLSMAFATSLPFDGYMAGSFLLALGGTFTFVPSFHLANAFPRFQGLILALITGAFDASASVFLIFRIVYQSSGGSFSLRRFFLLFLVVPVFILTTQILVMPRHSYETRAELTTKVELASDPTQDLHDSDDEFESAAELMQVRTERAVRRRRSIASINELLGDQVERHEFEEKEDVKHSTSGVWGVMHGIPALQQITSPWFVLITMFTVLQMMRFNFFIATIWSQYVFMLDSAREATKVIEFFDVALPVGGVVTVPFIGLLLDNASTVSVLNLLVLLSTIIGILGAVPTRWAAYANVCLFCVFRPLYYSAMSDYAVKVFGYATFGTVYGTIICLSGIFTFAQSGLQALLHKTFEDDPEPINLGLATAGLVLGISLVMYVDIKGRAIHRERRALGKILGGGGATGGGGGGGDDGGSGRWNGGTALPSSVVSSPSRRGVLDDPERQSLLPPRPLRPTVSRDLSTVQERAEPS